MDVCTFVYCSTIHNIQTMKLALYPTTDEWIKKMIYTHNGILFSNNEEWNYFVCRKKDGTEDHHVAQNKPD
jgi:hypothetical protein